MTVMPKKKKTPSEAHQFGLFQIAEIPNSYRKPVEIVHSQPQAPMSLLQRKLSNALLKNAIDNEADEEGFWSIGLSALNEAISFDSKNWAYMKASAKDLMSIVFEWDAISTTKKKSMIFKASVLFPEIEISTREFKYQISPQLKQLVLSPEIYAIVDLNELRKLKRGPSVALYEHCTRFVKIGITADVNWKKLRDIILGTSAGNSSYEEYKYFSSKVLKPCIAEINSLTNIYIELIVHKNGKFVQSLQFKVSKKEDEIEPQSSDTSTLEVIGEMIKLGVPQSEAKKLAQKHPIDFIIASLNYTKKMADKKGDGMASAPAYFRAALQNGWALKEDVDATPSPRHVKASAGTETPKRTLEDAYSDYRRSEASGYFLELDPPEQERLIAEYNNQQPVDGLRLKQNKKKANRASEIAFFNWLATHTWGPPTPADMLKFAEIQFAKI